VARVFRPCFWQHDLSLPWNLKNNKRREKGETLSYPGFAHELAFPVRAGLVDTPEKWPCRPHRKILCASGICSLRAQPNRQSQTRRCRRDFVPAESLLRGFALEPEKVEWNCSLHNGELLRMIDLSRGMQFPISRMRGGLHCRQGRRATNPPRAVERKAVATPCGSTAPALQNFYVRCQTL